MRLNKIVVICLAFIVHHSAWSQEDPILLSNPSFEDMPRHSKPPRGWFDCGFPGESPPDIQPSGTFNVTRPASDGNTYLGMVVRDNDTWESVSQRLTRSLEKDKCYSFRINLCKSELYVSTSRITTERANYTTPVKLRIYGGFGHCDKQFLLGETTTVNHTSWVEYEFKFEPIDNYTYIILEAFYKTPTLFPYNGNLLVDNASPIQPIPCDGPIPPDSTDEPEDDIAGTDKPETKTSEPTKPDPGPITKKSPEPEPQDTETKNPIVEEPNPSDEQQPQDYGNTEGDEEEVITLEKLDISKLKVGQTIRIDKLFFEADKSMISRQSYPVLDEIYGFLSQNKDVVVEIGGHTNGLPPHDYCDRLSTERAKAVADYLSGKGILENRLQYKGYGKRKPLESNTTAHGRRKNQRVEIKILSFNG